MNNFIDLLKRAFALWWRTKALWPLGMLAALVGYGDAAVGGNFNSSQSIPSDPEAELPPWLEDLPTNPLVVSFIDNPWPYILAAVALVIGLSIVAALVGALAHGAMIRTADVADQGYAATIGDGLRVGAGRTGALFLLNLVLALPVIVVLVLVGGAAAFSLVGAIASVEGGDGPANPGPIIASLLGLVFCAIGFFLLLWVVGIVLGVWARVAQRVCVIETRGAIGSLGRAWGLITRNLGLTLLTWLFQGVLGGVISFVMAIPALALAVPAFIAVAQGGAPPLGLLVALVIYAIAANIFVGGLLTSFNSAMWTVIYRSFTAREQPVVPYGAPA